MGALGQGCGCHDHLVELVPSRPLWDGRVLEESHFSLTNKVERSQGHPPRRVIAAQTSMTTRDN